MPSRHTWASVLLLAAATVWAVGLFVVPEPWTTAPAAVVGAGLVIGAATAAAGIMVEGSRFAHRLGIGDLVLMLVLAAIRPLGAWWGAGLGLAVLAGLFLADRRLGGWIRLEPPPAPVPAPAVALVLLLLVTPVVSALVVAARGGPIVWLALAAWSMLLIYVRRLRPALEVVRLGLPLLAAGGLALPLPGAVTWTAGLGAAAVLAWSSGARLAVRPLIERGTSVPVPPELLSDAVRRAAGIDRKYR